MVQNQLDEHEGRVDISSFFSLWGFLLPCWEFSCAFFDQFIGFRSWKVKFWFVLPAQGASLKADLNTFRARAHPAAPAWAALL